MGHLSLRMDALIRPATAMDLDRLTRKTLEYFLNPLLNRHMIRLDLPPGVGAPVIGHGNPVTEGR